MTLTFDLRARLLLLVLLLVVAGGVVGRDGLPAPAQVGRLVRGPAGDAPGRRQAGRASAPPRRREAASCDAREAEAPGDDPRGFSDKLPLAIRRALAADQVVVVALYDPRAKIDGTALAEAREGANLAGSAFVQVDVRTHGVDSLNAPYGAVQDPAVLVLRPPGKLVVRIDGFADRDTVAQAAVNAAAA